ncbi:MAG: FG-GAP repeat domain-containing protein [Acidobacteriota bacterium]
MSRDFDRDGKLDLAVRCDGTEDLIVFLGDGPGGLRQAAAARVGPQPTESRQSTSIATAPWIWGSPTTVSRG